MKITPKQYAELQQLLATPESLTRQARYAEHKQQGLSDVWFIWDCIEAIPNAVSNPWFRRVYETGCEDEHITTALRKALKLVMEKTT